MKILMLTDRLAIGGAETHIYELCRALARLGHRITLAAEEGAFSERLRNEGFSVLSLPLASKRAGELLRARRELLRLLREEHFDVVHAHARLPAFLVAPLCKRCGIPLVCTAHWVFETKGLRGQLAKWGERSFAVSEDIKEYLVREYGVMPAHVTVIENGIDTDAFPMVERKKSGRLLHVSRLDTGRAACAEALLSIAEELAKSGICHSLTIVGGGDRFQRILEMSKKANQRIGREFVRMVGAVTDVRPFLYEADLFVGVSRAALEAMATGMPVILAGDEGYLSLFGKEHARAAIESNFCCRGAPPIEAKKLFDDILFTLRSKDRASRGRFGADFVRLHYGIAEMARRSEAVYREVLRRPSVTICGYYGKQNTGDDAALAWLTERLADEGFSDICILGKKGERGTPPIHGHLTALSPSFLRRRGGIFLLGGGNLLQNETSNRSLFYYTHLLRRAKQAGLKTVVMGGIGRLDARGEEKTKEALRYADGFLMRTERDADAVRRLFPRERPSCLLPDGALWLTAKTGVNFDLPKDNCVIFAFRGGASNQTARELAKQLSEKYGRTPVFVPMQAGRDEARDTLIPHSLSLPHMPPDELLALMRECRAVVGDRLHALILAAAAGVPAVGITDGGKIDAFCDLCARRGGGDRIRAISPKTDALAAAILRALSLSRDDGGLLSRLRAEGENFSFLEFFALL